MDSLTDADFDRYGSVILRYALLAVRSTEDLKDNHEEIVSHMARKSNRRVRPRTDPPRRMVYSIYVWRRVIGR